MVQRKVSNRLGVLSDHVKTERKMANLKPTSQHQDYKNKASDLKIKMKKSRSMKLSDINSPRSSASKRLSLPGKPPPGDVPGIITTPQKQSPNRAMEWSPNYMKSTSSADARRGSSLEWSRDSKPFSDSKLFHKRDSSSSKVSSTSGNKLAKTSTKSSSMKLVRSLTKTPSFKNARPAPKKSSRVAICADINAQRATCSSTMKDSKFPQYLILNPGGTESEGTSAEKVCPYTYCSLNGHHHPPVPSLKFFLSTRRRSMKTQRSFKVEASSPLGAKKPAVEESEKVENTSLVQKVEMDYFIEIFAQKKENGGGNKDSQDANHKINPKFGAELEFFNDITYWGADVKQVVESLYDGPPCLEIDYGENHEHYGDNTPAEVRITENRPDAEKDSLFNLVQEKMGSERLVYGVNLAMENHEGSKAADTSSETTDMDWEDVQLFSEADHIVKVDLKSLSELEVNDTSELKVNDTEIISHEEIPCDEIVEYSSDGENGSSTAQFVNHYTEHDANNQDAEARSYKDGRDSPDKEFIVTGEKERFAESDVIVCGMDLTEDSLSEGLEEDRAKNFQISSQQGDDEISPGCQTMLEALTRQKENYDFLDTRTDTLVYNQDKNVADNHLEQELLNADCKYQVAETGQVANAEKLETEDEMKTGSYEITLAAERITRKGIGGTILHSGKKSNEELLNSYKALKWTINRKGATDNWEEPRKFNPREPNYLPWVPEPEAEKVDLRHQDMDERKNSEDWMLDHALQRTVNKLAPARKRKVALLVEAFESVLPVNKYDASTKNATEFLNTRPVQACN